MNTVHGVQNQLSQPDIPAKSPFTHVIYVSFDCMQQMIKPILGNETVYGRNISVPQRLSQMLHLKVVGTKEKERDKCTSQRNGSIVLLQKGVGR